MVFEDLIDLDNKGMCPVPEAYYDTDISLEEKIGSMIIVGFKGTSCDDQGVQQILSYIEKGEVSGAILYGYNIVSSEQLKNLTSLFNVSNQKPFVAVDQEGGRVQRLSPAKGFIGSPSAALVASNYTEAEARSIYLNMAQELQQHGINLNFAPIVDINNSSAPCEVIGKMDRSYGEEPEKVINYSQVFIDAHHECNTITCLKHFPGHGFVKGDSHLGMVDATSTASEVELIPYYRLIKEGKVDAIMTAHVVNKNLDPNYPATLSQVTLKKLLREQGYDGVIISDDLFMGAIVEHYELENSIQLAISAGCDMLIFSYNEAAYKKAAPNFVPPENIFETVVETVMQAISEGTITVAQIDDAYRRISTLKSKFLV